MMRLATILTCHNRREKTLACLTALHAAALPAGWSLKVFLVDDGSTDGTADAVRSEFPDVLVLIGNGSLFWNRGMRLGFEAALEQSCEYYLWLNDDTIILPDALTRMHAALVEVRSRDVRDAIIVGTTQDSKSGKPTYGGVNRARSIGLTFNIVHTEDRPIECDSMNGNCVLIPAAIAHAVGNLDPGFIHSAGDTDYGLRARAAGYSVWAAPGFVGCCSHNNVGGGWTDTTLPMFTRLRKILEPKGLPLRHWAIFTRRHGGFLWPLLWVWPYVKVMVTPRRHKS